MSASVGLELVTLTSTTTGNGFTIFIPIRTLISFTITKYESSQTSILPSSSLGQSLDPTLYTTSSYSSSVAVSSTLASSRWTATSLLQATGSASASASIWTVASSVTSSVASFVASTQSIPSTQSQQALTTSSARPLSSSSSTDSSLSSPTGRAPGTPVPTAQLSSITSTSSSTSLTPVASTMAPTASGPPASGQSLRGHAIPLGTIIAIVVVLSLLAIWSIILFFRRCGCTITCKGHLSRDIEKSLKKFGRKRRKFRGRNADDLTSLDSFNEPPMTRLKRLGSKLADMFSPNQYKLFKKKSKTKFTISDPFYEVGSPASSRADSFQSNISGMAIRAPMTLYPVLDPFLEHALASPIPTSLNSPLTLSPARSWSSDPTTIMSACSFGQFPLDSPKTPTPPSKSVIHRSKGSDDLRESFLAGGRVTTTSPTATSPTSPDFCSDVSSLSSYVLATEKSGSEPSKTNTEDKVDNTQDESDEDTTENFEAYLGFLALAKSISEQRFKC